jgi:hypothetical protein
MPGHAGPRDALACAATPDQPPAIRSRTDARGWNSAAFEAPSSSWRVGASFNRSYN